MTALAHIENIRQAEQYRIDRLRNGDERNRMGQFATPEPLASEIARQCLRLCTERFSSVRFLEPAVGTGVFYSVLHGIFPENLIQSAVGIELDDNLATAASSLWAAHGLEVRRGDFTKMKPVSSDEKFNLIMTNPPYVRHHHLDAEDKKRMKKEVYDALGMDISGLAGLYCYFVLLSDRWLTQGGIGAWLIPSEFMDVNYGLRLKEYLARRVKLLQVHRFRPDDVQFADALVSSAVVIYEKSSPPRNHSVKFSIGDSIAEPQRQTMVPLSSIDIRDKWTNYAECDDAERLRRKPDVSLGDLFAIKRGLATGANSFFIIERTKIREYGIPDDCVKPILPSPRYLRQVIIEQDETGYPQVSPQLAVIDCCYPQRVLKSTFPRFWNYLQNGVSRKIDQGYLTTRRHPWYSQEIREPAPFLLTYMGRNTKGPFRFLWNKSAAVATNVYLMLYPIGDLKRALDADNRLYQRVFRAVQKLDTGTFIGKGRVYGGGLYKMEPQELANIDASLVYEVIPKHQHTAGGRPALTLF